MLNLRRDPILAFWAAIAFLINLLAVFAFGAMLLSAQSAEAFGSWFPLSIATMHLSAATLAVIVVGIVAKRWNRHLFPILVLGLVPAIVATTFFISQYGHVFESSSSCPTVPIRDYALFVVNALLAGRPFPIWEVATGHAMTACKVRQAAHVDLIAGGLATFATVIVLWAIVRVYRRLKGRRMISEPIFQERKRVAIEEQVEFPTSQETNIQFVRYTSLASIVIMTICAIMLIFLVAPYYRWTTVEGLYKQHCGIEIGAPCTFLGLIILFVTIAPFLYLQIAYTSYQVLLSTYRFDHPSQQAD